MVVAHQNWSQTSERLRSALQNVGMEVVFALGREDAQYAAPMVGRVTPKTVRQTVSADESETAGMHEQWEQTVQTLEDLPPGQAFFYRRGQPVLQLNTPYAPLQAVPVAVVTQVEAQQLKQFQPPVVPSTPLPYSHSYRERL